MSETYTIKNAIIRYHDLFVPSQKYGKYSLTLMLPSNDPQIAELDAAIIREANEVWGAKAKEHIAASKRGDRYALTDGALMGKAEFEGRYRIKVQSQDVAAAFDAEGIPTRESKLFRPGCLVNARVRVNTWIPKDSAPNCTLKLIAIRYVAPGEPIVSGASITDDDLTALGIDPGALML